MDDETASSPGAPLVRLLNFAAHPTSIPAKLRRASADFPGVLCRRLERDGSVDIFMNGPSGDIASGIHPEESRRWWERRMEWMGAELEELAREAVPAHHGAARGAREGSVDSTLVYSEGEILLPPRQPWNLPFIGTSVVRSYPDRVRARAIRIGDVVLVFCPGEMGSQLGEQLREELLGRGAAPSQVFLVTLADDYFGYAFTRERYLHGGMSHHLTIYGEELGPVLQKGLVEIVRSCF